MRFDIFQVGYGDRGHGRQRIRRKTRRSKRFLTIVLKADEDAVCFGHLQT